MPWSDTAHTKSKKCGSQSAVRDYFDEGDYADCEYAGYDPDNPWIPPDDPEVQQYLTCGPFRSEAGQATERIAEDSDDDNED